MILVTSLVSILKPSDINLIRRIYQGKSSEEERSMRLKLLDLIIKEPDITDELAAQELYKTKPNKTFYQLKKRLRDDLGNFLIMQDKEKLYKSSIGRARFDCRRKLMIGELLMNRGAYTAAKKILSKGLQIAKDYELFGEIILIKDVLRMALSPKGGMKAFEQYSEGLDQDLKKQKRLLEAKALYADITLPQQFKLGDIGFVEYGQETLAKFEPVSDTSKHYQYYYYQSSVHYHYNIKDFKSCLSSLDKLEKIVASDKVLHAKARVAWCFNVYAEVYLNLKEYEQAAVYAERACGQLRKHMTNRLWALEKLFNAHFRQKDYEQALTVIEEANENKVTQKNVLIKARWDFFSAAVAFSKEDWQQASEKLHLTQKLAGTDSSGWQIGYKLLEIMLAIKEKEYYTLVYLLDNLKLLLHRQRQKKTNIERPKTILKILRTYQSQNFKYAPTLQKIEKQLLNLKEGQDPFYWNPLSYEIIRFDEWFMNLQQMSQKGMS